MKKNRDLFLITIIYIISFAVGIFFCNRFENIMLKQFVFDVVATIIAFIFSTILANSSVYDAYWSLTPMVMSIWLFATEKAFSPYQILFLVVFNLWSARLTLNWVHVFTDFTYEDWRYRKFREESPKLFWPLVNFWGIHMMPTLVVFAGMLPMYEIAKNNIGIMSMVGIFIMLMGISFEYFADKQMHRHLENDKSRSVCREGLWKYSRHPNYLGEITFWVGVYACMMPYAKENWYYGVGALSVCLLFNTVSIPLMEKRQMSRRADYKEYCEETQRLLLNPFKMSGEH